MKKKDLLIIILIGLNVLLLLDKFIDIVSPVAYGQVKDDKIIKKQNYDIEVPAMLANRIDVGELNANNVKIYGYDILKLNEKLLNVLASKGVIYYKEARDIIESSKDTTNVSGGGK
jgi:hypothetical protein